MSRRTAHRSVHRGVLATMLGLIVGGCTSVAEVLTTVDAGLSLASPWEDCESALNKGTSGDICSGWEKGCGVRTPDRCCITSAQCIGGVLTIESACVPDCSARCSSDLDCTWGEQWCEAGTCQPCSPEALCDVSCGEGFRLARRNGCSTCECIRTGECVSDADCGVGRICYAGPLCLASCAPGDKGCCAANSCSQAGCEGPSRAGCTLHGCPTGFFCDFQQCAPSRCQCVTKNFETYWECSNDCEGGVCSPEL